MDEMSKNDPQMQKIEDNCNLNTMSNDNDVNLKTSIIGSSQKQCDLCYSIFDVENYIECKSCNRKVCEQCSLKNNYNKETIISSKEYSNFCLCKSLDENEINRKSLRINDTFLNKKRLEILGSNNVDSLDISLSISRNDGTEGINEKGFVDVITHDFLSKNNYSKNNKEDNLKLENELQLTKLEDKSKINSFSGYINCHQCRRIEESIKMFVCSNIKCKESFCMTCIKKYFTKNSYKNKEFMNHIKSNWICIVCTQQCTCKSCKKTPKADIASLDLNSIQQNKRYYQIISDLKKDNIEIPLSAESIDISKSILNSSFKEETESLAYIMKIADEYKDNNSGRYVHKKCVLCQEKKFLKEALKRFKTLKGLMYYLEYMINTKKLFDYETKHFINNKEQFKEYYHNLSENHESDYKFHSLKNICLSCIRRKFDSPNGFRSLCESLKLPEIINNTKTNEKNDQILLNTPSLNNLENSKNSMASSTIINPKNSGVQSSSGTKKTDNYDIITTSMLTLSNLNKKTIPKDNKLGVLEITNHQTLTFPKPLPLITSEGIPSILDSLRTTKVNNINDNSSNNPDNFKSNNQQDFKIYDCKQNMSLQYHTMVQKSFINLLLDNLTELSEQLYNNQIISELVVNNLIKQIPLEVESGKDNYYQNLKEQLMILKKLNELGLLSCSNMKTELKDIESSGYNYLIKNHEKYQESKSLLSTNPVSDKVIYTPNNLTSLLNDINQPTSSTIFQQQESKLDQSLINPVSHIQPNNLSTVKNYINPFNNEHNFNTSNISSINKFATFIPKNEPSNTGYTYVFDNNPFTQHNNYNNLNQHNLQFRQSYNYPNLYDNQKSMWNNNNNYTYSNPNNLSFYNNFNYQNNINEITNHLYNSFYQNNSSIVQPKSYIAGENNNALNGSNSYSNVLFK